MTNGAEWLTETARELRRAFDATFAESHRRNGGTDEDFLAIRLAGDSYAVRLREIAGLFKDRCVTPLPSSFREFLGVAGIRGSIVPVYDLRTLLGFPPAGASRWLLLAQAPANLALAVDSFEGRIRAPRSEVTRSPSDRSGQHVSHAIRSEGVLRQVVDIASLVEGVRTRARLEGPSEER